MPGRAACGDPRAAGGRGREGQGGPETSLRFLRKEWTRRGGQAEDWLVWIVPAGSGAQGPSWLRGTCPGWRGQVDSGPEGGSPWRRCGRWALGWLICTGRRAHS